MTRIGNAERDAAIERLRSWYASGHLDDTDLDERITAALAARTDTELLKVAADLPVPVRRVVRVPMARTSPAAASSWQPARSSHSRDLRTC